MKNQTAINKTQTEITKSLNADDLIIKCGNCKMNPSEVLCQDCCMTVCEKCRAYNHFEHKYDNNKNIVYEKCYILMKHLQMPTSKEFFFCYLDLNVYFVLLIRLRYLLCIV